MPFTSIADFIATENPSEAELALIDACRAGTHRTLPLGTTEASLPPEGPATPDREVRAKLLRLLIMGGTPACGLHTSGIWLIGAYVTGPLDLRFVKTRGRLALTYCRLSEVPQLEQSEISQLTLSYSHVPGLSARGVQVEGHILLRNLTSNSTVDVAGSKIGGQLVCSDAVLDGGKDEEGSQKTALYAQGVEVKQSQILNNLIATGTVDVSGAKIVGQLVCNDAVLDGGKGAKGDQRDALFAAGVDAGESFLLNTLTTTGRVYLAGAKIGGQLDCEGASFDGGKDANGSQQDALNAQGMNVAGSFSFRGLKTVTGQVYLAAAHVGNLADDAASWPMGPGDPYLNGFTYDRIGGSSPLTLSARSDWLAKGSRFNGDFLPQPSTHFARVLRDMGHATEARRVLTERDRVLFAESHKANLIALTAARTGNGSDVGKSCLRYHLLRFWDWFSFVASGYGHAPQRALFVSFLAIGIGAILFFTAWHAGVMVPNSAIILTSPDWFAAMKTTTNAPSHAWIKLPSATHYETFYSLPYALDVFVPFVSLGQEQAWAATTTSGFGIFVRWFTFAYQITGWAITALGIAAITGFVQKNQPD